MNPCSRYVSALVVSLGMVCEAWASSHRLFVSNERSGDVSVVDGASHEVIATVPVGKPHRGLHVAHEQSRVYVALSGLPRIGPGAAPERARTMKADTSADGTGIVDARELRFVRKLFAGSDAATYAPSRDGRGLFVSTE